MEDGKIVFEGKSKQGSDFIIRYPNKNDAEAMLTYINTLSKEQTFVNKQGAQKTLEEEQKFLDGELKKIKEHKAVMLLVLIAGAVIGISGIGAKDGASSHVGLLGISIAKNFRGEGIGKTLMKLVLEEAEKHIPQLKLVELGVFDNNAPARSMYEKFGFKHHGTLPEGLLHRGEYRDHVYMYKKLK